LNMLLRSFFLQELCEMQLRYFAFTCMYFVDQYMLSYVTE
jgi:hypothetical protein